MSIETIVWCERCGTPLDQARENPVQAQVWNDARVGNPLHFHSRCWEEVRDYATAGRPVPPLPEPEPLAEPSA